MSLGRRKKDRGNFWYSRGEFTQAIQNYRDASSELICGITKCFNISILKERSSILPFLFCFKCLDKESFSYRASCLFGFISNANQCSSDCRKATDLFDDPDLDLTVPVDRFELPEEKQELLGERIKAFNNLAQGQMKIEAWDAALAALGNVLKIEVTLFTPVLFLD